MVIKTKARAAPRRVSAGQHGGGRFDFKYNTESDIDLVDCDAAESEFSLVNRVGLGTVSNDPAYLRAVEEINAATKPVEVGNALQTLLGNRGEVDGFDRHYLDLGKIKEAGITLADLYTKYPNVNSNVFVGDTAPNAAAEVLAWRKQGESKYFRMDMVISDDELDKNSSLDANFQKTRENGWLHSRNNEVSAVQYMITHEFGHLIDHTSEDRVNITSVALDYGEEKGWRDPKDWDDDYTQEVNKHLSENISGYGKKDCGEVIAEAFADVECNGDNAFDYSKVLYRKLRGELNAS